MKKIHKSKTFWSNILIFALLFIPELDHEFFNAMGVDEKITTTIVAILTRMLVILNIVFRFYSNEKIVVPKLKNQSNE